MVVMFYAFITGGGAAVSFTTVMFYVRDLQPETEHTTCFVQPISDNEENKHDEVVTDIVF